jgi:hypothetical protein
MTGGRVAPAAETNPLVCTEAGFAPLALLRTANFAMAAVALLALLALGKNIASPNFWFDEADQFWLAMGEHLQAGANTVPGGWGEVWRYSRSFNADPGGFTVLLRLWIGMLGTAPVALRLLPALFGCIFFCLTYVWARRMQVPRPAAIAIVLLFLLSQNVPYFMLELRAYSMELCGVVALWLATAALLQRPAPATLAAWIAVDWLFLSSRYSFVIYAAAACGILLWRAVKDPHGRRVFLLAVLAAALWIALLYFGMLRFQTNGSPPDYVVPLMLKGHFENFLPILARNFFHPAAIGKTAFLVCLLAILLLRRRVSWLGKLTEGQLQPFFWLAGYILLAELGWMTLSALGKLPWDVSKRWGLSEYGLTALAIPALFSLVWMCLKGRPRSSPLFLNAGMTLLCAGSLVVGFASLWMMAKRFDREKIVPEHLYRAMGAIDCTAGNSILLDDGLWPNYRYLTERSGLPIPCGGRLPVEIVPAKDPGAYATLGLSRRRPVIYLFGNWDPSFKQGVLQRLGGQGEIKAESFGPSDFTSVVTLK